MNHQIYRRPAFGTREEALLRHAQLQVLKIYAHLLREMELGKRRDALKQLIADDWSRVDAERFKGLLISFEDEGVLNSAGRLLRWLNRAKNDSLIPTTFGTSFFDQSKKIKQLRDIREHLDEYIMGEGRQRANFNFFFATEGDRGYDIGAHYNFTLNGVKYYGGRVRATELASAVREIYDEFCSLDLWLLPWTPQLLSEEFDYKEDLREID